MKAGEWFTSQLDETQVQLHDSSLAVCNGIESPKCPDSSAITPAAHLQDGGYAAVV